MNEWCYVVCTVGWDIMLLVGVVRVALVLVPLCYLQSGAARMTKRAQHMQVAVMQAGNMIRDNVIDLIECFIVNAVAGFK